MSYILSVYRKHLQITVSKNVAAKPKPAIAAMNRRMWEIRQKHQLSQKRVTTLPNYHFPSKKKKGKPRWFRWRSSQQQTSKTCETHRWTFWPQWTVTQNGPFIDTPTLQPDTEMISATPGFVLSTAWSLAASCHLALLSSLWTCEHVRQALQRQKRTEDSYRNTLHMLQTFIWLICEANVRVSAPLGRCRLLFEGLSQLYLQKTWVTLMTQKMK